MTARMNQALQIFRVVTVVLTVAVLGAGCGDSCHDQQAIREDRKVTGQLTYQPPGAAPAVADLGGPASFSVNAGPAGEYPGAVAFTLTDDGSSDGTTRPIFQAQLVVRVASRVASQEIDLTDDDGSLTVRFPDQWIPIPYHGLAGHLSLEGIDTSCQYNCLLRARGTLAISATGPNEEAFALTSGTFVANDTFYEYRVCGQS